jgi:monoamine oxidase
MKKWMYVIFPGIMLGLFLIVYTSHVKEAEEREQRRLVAIEEKRKEDEAKKKKAEELAAEDAKKRQEERDAEEAKKEADRRRKQEAADKEVADKTAEYRGKADNFAKKVSQAEIELDRLHKERETANREDLELAKRVELAEVAKQNAELREQHLMQMIAMRADQSTMAQMPPPPPAK